MVGQSNEKSKGAQQLHTHKHTHKPTQTHTSPHTDRHTQTNSPADELTDWLPLTDTHVELCPQPPPTRRCFPVAFIAFCCAHTRTPHLCVHTMYTHTHTEQEREREGKVHSLTHTQREKRVHMCCLCASFTTLHNIVNIITRRLTLQGQGQGQRQGHKPRQRVGGGRGRCARAHQLQRELAALSKWLWSTCQEDQRQLLT